MKMLEDRIRKDGIVREGNVLKVDSFINHQMDIPLFREMAKEWKRLFDGKPINKVLTIEASGIGIAAVVASEFNVPVVFAKKSMSINLDYNNYETKIQSFTHKKIYNVIVSKKFLTPEDHVLIIDDFLANGCALLGLLELTEKAGATVEGIGMCIPINSAKPLINKVLSGEITFTAPEALDNSDENKADSNTDSTLVGKPRMGITMSNLANSRALQNGQIPKGVYVVNVEENSPAEKAGMQVGDIIVDVNDNVITSTTELAAQVADCKAGDVLKIKVYRVPGITDLTGSDDIPDGEYIDLEVTLEVIDNVKQ